MHSHLNPLILKLSAVVGLVAGIGVFAAGVMQDQPARAGASQPVLSEWQQAMQRADRAMQAQSWPEAIKGYERVLELNPGLAVAAFRLAYSVHMSGDLERAIGLHEAAAEHPQARPVALYNLGCAHARLGQSDEAFAALKRAIDAGYNGAGNPLGLAGAYEDPDLDSIQGDARFAKLFGGAPINDASHLHFWVGQWDCYSATSRKQVGTNTLALRNKDQAILEHWEASDGTGGESWNWFDPVQSVWRQVWVDDQGRVTEFVGTRQGDGVMFEGKASNEPDAIQRMHVRPIGDGRVQQTGTTSKDEGKTWLSRYDLIYVPKGQKL